MQSIIVKTIQAGNATVEVREIGVGLNVADLRAFEITTSTGYRAYFPEAHTECDRTPCVKIGCWATHKGENRCHGPHHLEQIEAYAAEIAATYRPARLPAPRKAAKDWTPAAFERLAGRIVEPGRVTAELAASDV
jgi:hypothetical protein